MVDPHTARDNGYACVKHPLFGRARCERAIALAREFFSLPPAAKDELAIERSAHFRGYSRMRNERDWREQIHFGREETPGSHPLQGPNLWPPDSEWRREILRLMADLEQVGCEVLNALGYAAGENPYLLLKLIHYERTLMPRSGVAAHVDFSWLTLLLQDDSGGLEVCTPRGEWVAVPPRPGTLVLNLGEIIEFVSGGVYRATPHRVTSKPEPRISLPFFLNPGLGAVISPAAASEPQDEREHVHRVYRGAPPTPFLFGDAEWRRKGLGRWCYRCA